MEKKNFKGVTEDERQGKMVAMAGIQASLIEEKLESLETNLCTLKELESSDELSLQQQELIVEVKDDLDQIIIFAAIIKNNLNHFFV